MVRRSVALGVVVDSDLLPKTRSVVLIPLVEGMPRAGALNPTLKAAGRERILHTRAIAAVRADALEDVGETLEADRDVIVRAIDILISGV